MHLTLPSSQQREQLSRHRDVKSPAYSTSTPMTAVESLPVEASCAETSQGKNGANIGDNTQQSGGSSSSHADNSTSKPQQDFNTSAMRSALTKWAAHSEAEKALEAQRSPAASQSSTPQQPPVRRATLMPGSSASSNISSSGGSRHRNYSYSAYLSPRHCSTSPTSRTRMEPQARLRFIQKRLADADSGAGAVPLTAMLANPPAASSRSTSSQRRQLLYTEADLESAAEAAAELAVEAALAAERDISSRGRSALRSRSLSIGRAINGVVRESSPYVSNRGRSGSRQRADEDAERAAKESALEAKCLNLEQQLAAAIAECDTTKKKLTEVEADTAKLLGGTADEVDQRLALAATKHREELALLRREKDRELETAVAREIAKCHSTHANAMREHMDLHATALDKAMRAMEERHREERELARADHAETMARADARLAQSMASAKMEHGLGCLNALSKGSRRRMLARGWSMWRQQASQEVASQRVLRRLVQLAATNGETTKRAALVLGMRQWRAAVMETAREHARRTAERRAVLRVVSCLMRGAAGGAFYMWLRAASAIAAAEKSQQAKLLALEGALARDRARQGSGVVSLTALLKRWQHQQIAGGWRAWTVLCNKRKALEALAHERCKFGMKRCADLMVSSEKRRCAASLRAWLTMIRWEKRRKKLLGTAGRRIFKAQLWQVFGHWVNQVRAIQEVAKRKHHLRNLFLRRALALRKGKAGIAWRSWWNFVHAAVLNQSKLDIDIANARTSTIEWHRRVSDGVNQLSAIVRHQNTLKVSFRFGVWKSAFRDAQMLIRSLSRIENSALASSFETWLKGVEMKRQLLGRAQRCLDLIKRSLNNASRRRLVKGWHYWQNAARALKAEQLNCDVLKRRLIAKTVRGMAQGHLARGLRQWAATTRAEIRAEAEAVHKRFILKRIISVMRCGALSPAWLIWTLSTVASREFERRQRHYCERLFDNADKTLLRCGFAHFAEQVDRILANEDRARASLEALEKCKRATLSVLVHQASRLTAASWRSWVATTLAARQAELSQAKLLPRIVGRLKVSNIRTSVLKWRACVQEHKRLELRSVGVSMMTRVLKGVQKATKFRSFRSWRYRTSLLLQAESRLRQLKGIGASIFRHKTYKAWSQWRAVGLCAERVEAQLRRCINKMLKRKATTALVRWRYHLAAKAAHLRELNRQRTLVRRTFLIMDKSNLVLVFKVWLRKLEAFKLAALAQESQASNIASGLGKLGLGLRKSLVGRAYRTWSGALIDAIETEEAKRHADKVLRRGAGVVARVRAAMLLQELRAGFKTWHFVMVTHMKRVQEKCHSLLRMLTGASALQTRRVWNQWKLVVRAAHQQALVMKRVVKRKASSGIRGALGQWRSVVQEAKEFKIFMQKSGKQMVSVLRRLLAAAQLGYWLRWRDAVRQIRDAERILRRASRVLKECWNRMSNREIAAGLRKWKLNVEAEVRYEVARRAKIALFIKVMQGKADMKLGQSLRKWTKYVGGCKVDDANAVNALNENRKRVTLIINRLSNKHVALAWAQWRCLHDFERCVTRAVRILRYITAGADTKALTRAFRFWHLYMGASALDRAREESAAAARRYETTLLRRVLNRCGHLAPLQSAWLRWMSHVEAERQEHAFQTKLTQSLDQQRQVLEKNRAAAQSVSILNSYALGCNKAFIRKGWNTLRTAVASHKFAQHREKRLRLIASRLCRRTVVTAWNSWYSATSNRARRLRATSSGFSVLKRWNARRVEASLRGCIDRWFLAVHSPTVQLVNGSRAIQLLFAVDMRHMQRSLLRWRALVGRSSPTVLGQPSLPISPSSPALPESPSRLQLAQTMPSKSSERSVSSPIVQHSREMHHFRRLLWSHVASQSSVSDAWAQGRASVLGASQRTMALLLCRRLHHKALFKTWSTWCHYVKQTLRAEMWLASRGTALRVLSRFIVGMEHSGLLSAWNKWQSFVSAAVRANAEAAAAVEKMNIGLRLVSRWLERLRVNTIGGAFNKWTGKLDEQQELARSQLLHLTVLEKFLSNAALQTISRRFRTWRDYSTAAQAKLKNARKALLSITLATQKTACNTWRGVVAYLREQAAIQARQTAAVRRVVANLAHASATRGLRQWRDATKAAAFEAFLLEERAKMAAELALVAKAAQTKETASKLRRVVRSLLASQLRTSFYTWQQKLSQEIEAKKKVALLCKTLGRITLAAQTAAWNSWIGFVMHARDEEKAMKQLLGRILHIKEAMGFEIWNKYVEHAREGERLEQAKVAAVRKVAMNLTNNTLVRGLRQWRDSARVLFMEEVKGAEIARLTALLAANSLADASARMEKVLKGMTDATLRKGWHTWQQKVAAHTSAKKKLAIAQRTLGRIMLSMEASGWNAWCAFVVQAQDAEKAMKQLLGRILKLKEAMAWHAWSAFVAQEVEEERLAEARTVALRRVTGCILRVREARSLRQWRATIHAMAIEAVQASERAKYEVLEASMNQAAAAKQMKRMLSALKSSHLKKAWSTWKLEEQARKTSRAALAAANKTICRLLLATQASAWNSWCGVVAHAQDEERAMHKIFCRISTLKLATGWETWRFFVRFVQEEEHLAQERAALVRKVVLSVTNATCARALRKWHEETRAAAQAKAIADEQGKFAQLLATCRAIEVKRILHLIKTSALRKGWSTWKQQERAFLRAKKKLVSAQKTLGCISLRAQAAAMNTWRGVVAYEQETEKAMKKLLGRILSYKEAIAWACWRRFVVSVRHEESAMQARAAAVRKVAANIVHTYESRGLRQWRDAARSQTYEELIARERANLELAIAQATQQTNQATITTKLKHVIQSMLAAQLRKGWRSWRQQEVARMQAEAKLTTARKTLQRAMLATQVTAWNAWCAFVVQAQEAEKAMKQLLGRILKLKEAMAWHAWSAFVRDSRETERLAKVRAVAARKVAGRMLHAYEARGLRQWRKTTDSLALEAEQAAHRAAMAAAYNAAAATVATERAKVEAASALAAQQKRQAEAASQRQYWLHRVVRDVSTRGLRSGWVTWRDFVVASLMREVEERVETRVAEYERARADELIAKHQFEYATQQLKRVVKRVAMCTLRSRWQKWKQKESALALAKRKLLTAQKTLGRMTLAAQAGAWNSWRGWLTHMREKDKATRKLLGRISMLQEAMGWAAWQLFVRKTSEAERVKEAQAAMMRRVVGKLRSSYEARGLRQWREVTRKLAWELAMDAELKQFATRINQASARTKLASEQAQQALVDSKMRHIVGSMLAGQMRKGWYAWKQKHHAFKQAQAKLTSARKTIYRITLAAQYAAWNTWRGMVARARETEKTMKVLLLRILRMKEATGIDAWKQYVQRAQQDERNMETLVREQNERAEARKVAAHKVARKMLHGYESRGLRQWRSATHCMALEFAAQAHRSALELSKEEERAARANLLKSRHDSDQERQLKRVLRAFGVATLRSGWNTWRDIVVHLLVAEVQAKVREEIILLLHLT